jgi:A/G-specific adenine glycosylase
MWEFPRVVLEDNETHEHGARRLIRSLGLKAEPKRIVATIRYSVTRFRMTMACFAAKAQAASFRMAYYEEGQWLHPRRLADYPLSTPQRKVADALPGRPPEHE